MLVADGALGLLFFALWVGCILDVIMTDGSACRNLPKIVWLIIVVLFPDIGSIAWLVAGHPWNGSSAKSLPYRGNTGAFPEYDRPGRVAATNPDDDEAFLRQVKEKADRQRQDYQQRRKAELEHEAERLRKRLPKED